MDRLYKEGEQREDETQNKAMYSQLAGMHSMQWSEAALKHYVDGFNACVDKITASFANMHSRADTGKMSKDKTTVLQLLPTLELFEAVLSYLLKNLGVVRSHL